MTAVLDNNLATSVVVTAGNPSTSFTVGSGANRFLVVVLVTFGGATGTSCTYAGVSMTKQATVNANISGNSQRCVTIFTLVNPATGPNTIAGVTTDTNAVTIGILAASFTGVHQTTPLGTAATSATSATSASGTVTTTASDLVYSAIGIRSTGTLTATGTSQTALNTEVYNSNILAGHSTQAPSGSSTISAWSWNTAADNNAAYTVPIKAVSSPASLVFDDRRVRRNSLLRR